MQDKNEELTKVQDMFQLREEALIPQPALDEWQSLLAPDSKLPLFSEFSKIGVI